MSDFGFAAAQHVLGKALELTGAKFQRPICVAVCDPSGALLAFARQDGAPLRSVLISQGKAYTAARMGVTTQAFHERIAREQLQSRDFCDDRLTAVAGGAPLKNSAGKIVGAAGISGLTSAEDQEIANLLAEITSKL